MDASPDPTGEPAGASGGSAALALAVVAFATAMAYVEAAVVVDLRAALGVGSDVLRLGHVPGTDHFVVIEFGRELATLVMLGAVGWLAARTRLERLAWGAVAFGTWDILYYAWLYSMIGWPAALETWDVLFLVPVAWVGPVWAPMVVSAALVGFGLAAAARLRRGEALRISGRHIAATASGGLLVVLSFILTASTATSGAQPSFWWPLFALGMALAAASGIVVLLHRPGGGLEASGSDPS